MVGSGLAHASWLAMPYGEKRIPQNAMVAGQYPVGTLLYACQASYMGGVHSGWTTAGKGSCSIGWGGKEVALPSFSIWQNDWAPASNGAVPWNALEFGSEPSPAPSGGFSIPRARYPCVGNDLDGNGNPVAGTSSGKVGLDLGACLFGWGGLEIHQPNYSVLVDDAFVYYQDGWYTSEVATFDGTNPLGIYQPVSLNYYTPIPYDAVLSAYEANGIPLYVCNTFYVDGYQIGKTRHDYRSCDISYGGGEYWEYNYNVLVPYWTANSNGNFPYRTQVPNAPYEGYNTAVASGVENGAAFYLCRASLDSSGAIFTGKVNHNLGFCSIGFNGAEHVVTSYSVLTDRYSLRETVVR